MSDKINGILTFHDGINHGAYLQVYSLVNYIKNCGLNVEIINYKNVRHYFNEYSCVLRTKDPILFIKMLRKIIIFKKYQLILPMAKYYKLSNKIDDKRYDTVIFGSDEIWNYQQPIVGYDLNYFGKNINADRLISYAASFGALNGEKVIIPAEICSLIKKFDKISVRDSNSLNIIQMIGRNDAELVVDPVFLIDFPINAIDLEDKEFILVYAAVFCLDLQKEICSFAKKIGKKLISVGYMNRWCDKNIIAIDPFTWLAYFQKASIVITSMFHGTMISIKYGKQFCTLVDPYRMNKFKGIMERLELTQRIKHEGLSLENIFESQIDFSSVNALLNPFIKESKEFLNNALIY